MNKTLLYSRFFPPRSGRKFACYISNAVKDFPRVIKYSWQRTRRGWADCDVWSIDYWFCTVTPSMLRKLAEDRYGVPVAFVVYDENGLEVRDLEDCRGCFEKTLHQMADDLEAVDKFWEENLPGGFEEEQAAERRRKAGLASFYEWFDCLWS